MKENRIYTELPAWFPAVLSPLLAILGLLQYGGVISIKYIALVAGVGTILLLLFGEAERLWNLPSLLLLGYTVFSMLTGFWAMSGKFFLQRYSIIFVAAFFFLLIVLWKQRDEQFALHVAEVLAGISAFYAFISIEARTTGLTAKVLSQFPFWSNAFMSGGARLSGVFLNSNLEASFFALGIIFSIALICRSKSMVSRGVWAALLTIDAVAMLLGVSLGAIACFAVAVVVYLIFSGEHRGAVLIRMLEGAGPAAVCVLLTYRSFSAEEGKPEALLGLVAAVLGTIALERFFAEKLTVRMKANEKLLNRSLIVLAALFVVYVAAALLISTPHTFGDRVRKGVSLAPGEHSLEIIADGEISVEIATRSLVDIMYDSGAKAVDRFSTEDDAYQQAGRWTFAIPEDSEMSYFFFSGEEGTTLRSAVLDGSRDIRLGNKLIPRNIASRLDDGLFTSNSFMQRRVLARDGLKLFWLSPIIGNGVGSFETGISRVQTFYFETRYVHEHYVQVLLEDGVLGFAFFAGALGTMIVALWKKRKQIQSGPFFWIFPALCAEMAMNCLQMLWDVSMSIMSFLCCSYAVYGLIVDICAEPIQIKQRAEAEQILQEGEEERKTESGVSFPAKLLLGFVPLIYVGTICGNLYAAQLVSREFHSYDEVFDTIEKAIKIDLYERNDSMLTYVMMAMEEEESAHISQANVYADQLSKVQSNRIPYYLVGYYFNSMQYERALDEAMLGATYSASDADQWNNIIGLLKQGFIDSGAQSPLWRNDDNGILLGKLIEYYNMLQDYNAGAMSSIRLTETNEAFMDAVLALSMCNGDREAIYALLTTSA